MEWEFDCSSPHIDSSVEVFILFYVLWKTKEPPSEKSLILFWSEQDLTNRQKWQRIKETKFIQISNNKTMTWLSDALWEWKDSTFAETIQKNESVVRNSLPCHMWPTKWTTQLRRLSLAGVSWCTAVCYEKQKLNTAPQTASFCLPCLFPCHSGQPGSDGGFLTFVFARQTEAS